jgi:hypothetical protein
VNRDRAHPVILDPGWLFLVAGITLVGATILLPASEDLAEARHRRDVALVYEAHRKERIARYEEYIKALDTREPSLVYSLAASQLNQIGEGRGMIGSIGDARSSNVSVFPALEPPPMAVPERVKVESRLQHWAMNERTRMLMLAGGMLLVLIGLLPAARRSAPDPRPSV